MQNNKKEVSDIAGRAMGLSRKHLCIITGLLTGHVALNRNLTVMKIHTDPVCPKCGEEEETAYHFLGSCSAMMMAHYGISSNGYHGTSTSSNTHSSLEIHITFWSSRGCTLGQN